MTQSMTHPGRSPAIRGLRPILSLAMLSLLGACAAPGLLKQAEDMDAGGSLYAAALHSGYLQQARLEIDEADYPDSAHFSIKALAAADGGDVRPDMLVERHIGKRSTPVLAAARSRLMDTKSALAIEVAPRAMAGAQVAFDCWLQEAEENSQPEDIETCHENFEISLARVGAALTEYQARAEALQAIAPAAALVSAEQTVQEPRPYTIHFPLNSAVLSDLAVSILDQAVAAFDGGDNSRIRVAGHADSAGDTLYNETLSSRRAKAVAAYLASKGIASDLIQARWYGEDRPLVPSMDGAQEPQNRRVEVGPAPRDRTAAK